MGEQSGRGHDDRGDGTERPRFGPSFRHGLAVIFLCVGPLVYFSSFWRNLLPDFWEGAFTVAFWLAMIRIVVATSTYRLNSARTKGTRDHSGEVDEDELARLQHFCEQQGDDPRAIQLRYFAESVLSPRVIRKRTTDRYVPAQRTVEKTVSMEIDLESPFLAWPATDDKYDEVADAFIALTLPQKGKLYDDLVTTDAGGQAISLLSQAEYRVLVAKTLRALLRAAYNGRGLSDDALKAERAALIEILRFPYVDQRPDESAQAYKERLKDESGKLTAAVSALINLRDKGGALAYLSLAAEFMSKLARNYAVVAVIPAGRLPRFVISYSRQLIPDLTLDSWFTWEGLKNRLRLFLGARPVFLSVNARNAVLCQSYHLLVMAPKELYVGNFNIQAIASSTDHRRLRCEPYWHVRGRRGQNYFHLYTRGFKSKDVNPKVEVKFFEVPPGSLIRAGLAAIASFGMSLAVGLLVARLGPGEEIDTEIAVFLLALPGIAAAWLGFESRQGQLFEGTLAARLSLLATFVLSISASIVLLLNTAHTLEEEPVRWYILARSEPSWTIINSLAFVNTLSICNVWWIRSRYYQMIATKPVGDAAVLLGK